LRETLKSVGSAALGIAGVILLFAVPILFIKGGLWAAEHFLPLLSTVGGIVLGVDVLLLLPLSLFPRLRGMTGGGIFISSYVFGLTLWLGALILTYYVWGVLAVLIGFFIAGVGVVPIALLATGFNGMWPQFWDIVIACVFTFGARMLGLLIASKAPESSTYAREVA
jgi:hypothetical protein